MISIVAYQPELKDFFYLLNREWIDEFYEMTAEDEKILKNPQDIIDAGGAIFFAKINMDIIGTCALAKTHFNEYELIKMGVTKKHRKQKAGFSLMTAAIQFARDNHAKKITLETARELQAAIHLYEACNFKRVGEEYKHPLFGRKVFKMELDI